jgi:hypothetical protein
MKGTDYFLTSKYLPEHKFNNKICQNKEELSEKRNWIEEAVE